jgi:Ca2+-binding RTX toxin-like protein
VAHGGYAEGDTLFSIENLWGSSYNDILRGNSEANTLKGDDGNDVLYGEAGRDLIGAGGGNDTLFGGQDDDILYGDAGSDYVEGGHGADRLDGGGNFLDADTLSYFSSGAGVTVNLKTNAVSGGDAHLDIISGFENVTGSAFADNLTGTGSGSVIRGLAGNDVLNDGYGNGSDHLDGGSGDDILSGSGGMDTLVGGEGNDVMTGGGGTGSYGDTFIFAAVNQQGMDGTTISPGYDTITDFAVGVDRLGFTGTNTLWDLNFAQVGSDTVITYEQADGAITLVGVNLSALLQHQTHDLILM